MDIRNFIVFASVVFLLSPSGIAQIGINTINPVTTLDVGGNTYLDGTIKIDTLKAVSRNDETILMGQTGTDFIKEVRAQADGEAIAYFQEYELTNMGGGGDWINDLNTSISASDYVVTIISVYYNKDLNMSSANNFVVPYASAFVSNGTWHITADYASASPVSTNPVGKWIVSTLILSNQFSKQFPQQEVIFSGTNEERRGGAATTPVID